LRALIRDPDNGALLELSRDGWERSSDDGGFAAGFDEDFVDPGDFFQPGPPAVTNGYLRPVLIGLLGGLTVLEETSQAQLTNVPRRRPKRLQAQT
jgi:hypothetical protein